MRHTAGLFVRAALVLCAVGIFALLSAYVIFDHLRHANGPHTADAYFYVKPGAQPDYLAARLEQEGLIASAEHYKWLHRWYQLPFTQPFMPKIGEYAIPAGASLTEIALIFHKGVSVQRRITFPEGLTTNQIIERIENAIGLEGTIPDVINEGVLFPDTYFYQYGMKKVDIIHRMQAKMEMELAQSWAQRAEGLPYKTAQEALIMASIIEKETGVSGERTLVASVFVNRLKLGMRLQSDPTVIYGVGQTGVPNYAITKSDLNAVNDYNTYKIKALPAGPIANPGRASLEAALNPAVSEYLYFVANGDGGHFFSKNLDEHNKNVRKYREIVSKVKIKK